MHRNNAAGSCGGGSGGSQSRPRPPRPSRPPPPTQTTSAWSGSSVVDCSKEDGLFPDPDNCRGFIKCAQVLYTGSKFSYLEMIIFTNRETDTQIHVVVVYTLIQ